MMVQILGHTLTNWLHHDDHVSRLTRLSGYAILHYPRFLK